MFAKSIRWRLLSWVGFLLVCILTGFGVTSYQLYLVNQFSQIDEALERRASLLSNDIRHGMPFGRPPPGHFGLDNPEHPPRFDPGFGPKHGFGPWSGPREIRLTAETQSLFNESDDNGYYFAVWSREGVLLRQSTNAPPELPKPAMAENDTRFHAQTRDRFRESFHFTELGDCVLVGQTIEPDLRAIGRFGWWLGAAGAAIFSLGLAGAWLMAGRALKPIDDISGAAMRISAGHLSQRIDVADTDSELGRLAGILNSTFARLEAAFEEQKQFTADASHELRTPLTVLISDAQTTLARERTAEEYRETLQACLETAQQMRRLTQSLLELARFDSGQGEMLRVPVDLAAHAQECTDQLRPLARERGIQIHTEFSPASATGDPDRIRQVIMNLLTNALEYNRDGGEIRVKTETRSTAAVLTVADTGIGIDAPDLPHIFERFYRADKSRTRAVGGSGLGLAISKAIVDALGGTIQVASEPACGSSFTLTLPGG